MVSVRWGEGEGRGGEGTYDVGVVDCFCDRGVYDWDIFVKK